jgi:23S rRNA pseudouridine2605 synthase
LLRDQLGERLIDEAGADFEAPVTRPFSNKPVRAGEETRPKKPGKAALRVEEGGLVRNRKREREQRREDALGRLQTERPSRFGGPAQGKKTTEEKKRDTPARPRGSNVWMAPGARPVGKKKVEDAPERRRSDDRAERPSNPRREDRKERPQGPRGGKSFEKRPAGAKAPERREGRRPDNRKPSGPGGRGAPRGGSRRPPKKS